MTSRQGPEISLSESTQTGSEVHSASYSTGIGDSFLEGKAAGAESPTITTSI